MSGLEIAGMTVRYGDTTAVHDVDLTVASGEVVAVIGPSGCGKSSMLRAIAGLQTLHSGTVRLGGRDLDGVRTHQRDLGLMFQDHALFPHLSVADNVAFGLQMQKLSKPRQRSRVLELLELVGLAGFGSRRIDTLSGGEAQRVALARALAPSPSLVMLDEPLGSLDRLLREQLVGELRDLFVDLGVTALHVTHDQAEAFALADRVVILNEGEVLQEGTPFDLWHNPSSAYVARFLGHPNVWSVGSETVLVPVPAIRLLGRDSTANADQLVVVERIEFADGRFRIVATSATDTLCGLDIGNQKVSFDVASDGVAASDLVEASELRVTIDESRIVLF